MAVSNYLVLYKALMWLMGNALNKGTKTVTILTFLESYFYDKIITKRGIVYMKKSWKNI